MKTRCPTSAPTWTGAPRQLHPRHRPGDGQRSASTAANGRGSRWRRWWSTSAGTRPTHFVSHDPRMRRDERYGPYMISTALPLRYFQHGMGVLDLWHMPAQWDESQTLGEWDPEDPKSTGRGGPVGGGIRRGTHPVRRRRGAALARLPDRELSPPATSRCPRTIPGPPGVRWRWVWTAPGRRDAGSRTRNDGPGFSRARGGRAARGAAGRRDRSRLSDAGLLRRRPRMDSPCCCPTV